MVDHLRFFSNSPIFVNELRNVFGSELRIYTADVAGARVEYSVALIASAIK